jgi:N-glycosylase/DNA lyase
MTDDQRRELHAEHRRQREAIRARLRDFRHVPTERYFYELCFCLMTPQSSAAQCDKVARELERLNFRAAIFDPAPLLRSHEGGYVRFHHTKARRLEMLKLRFDDVDRLLIADVPTKECRSALVQLVSGLGLKEASHFLRNIGRTDVTIIDRHIIRNLIRLHLLEEWPSSVSPKKYLALETRFESLAEDLGIPADELDLLLWSRETGFILK